MILYENNESQIVAAAREYFAFMDSRYTAASQLFAHDRQYEVLADIVTNDLDVSRPVRVFDLGCGQGQLLARAYDLIKERAPEIIDASRFVGLDASTVAIRQSEERYPHLSWILDTFQEFADNPTNRSYLGSFDLVINRGGLVVVNTVDELRPLLRVIHDLLAPKGVYFNSEGVSHYQVWINRVFRNAYIEERTDDTLSPIDLIDPFDLSRTYFSESRRVPDDGFYLQIYRKGGRPEIENLDLSRAVAIEYRLAEGRLKHFFVAGDETSYRRLGALLSPVARVAPYEFPIPHQYNDSARRSHEQFAEAAAARYKAGRNSIIVPGCRFRDRGGNGQDLTASMIGAVGEIGNVAYYPRYLQTVRDYSRRLDEMLAADPDGLILGCGLDDHAINNLWGQPRVDLAEFSNILDWMLERLTREEGRSVVWLTTRLRGDPDNRQQGWSYDDRITRQFMFAEAAICDRYSVPCIEIPDTDVDLPGLVAAHGLALTTRTAPLDEPSDPDPRYPNVVSAEVVRRGGDRITIPLVQARSIYLSPNHDMEDKESDDIDGGSEYPRVLQRRLIDWLHQQRRPGLPELMLIGDSVRMRRDDVTGYVLPAYERLVGHYNLTHIAHNTQGTKAVLKWLPQWLEFGKPDVVHINAGLHDLAYEPETQSSPAHTDVETYRANVERIVAVLREHGVKRVVWASSTPVVERWHNAWHEQKAPRRAALRFLRRNEDIRRYNAAAADVMRSAGILINDLYAIVEEAGMERCIRGDGVHLNPVGSQIVGAAVASYLTEGATRRVPGPIWTEWQAREPDAATSQSIWQRTKRLLAGRT